MDAEADFSPPSPAGTPDRGKQRWKRLLNRADKDPSSVLDEPRCLKPRFCESYLELCDGKALAQPTAAKRYAEVAVELAEKIGEPCLENRSRGVLVHAHLANREWAEALEVLNGYEAQSVACCGRCASDFYRRRGDVLVEMRRTMGAKMDLEKSLTELGDELDPHDLAMVCFVRGISHHFNGDVDLAVEDAGRTLLDLRLDSPRGYFHDTLAFVACFLVRGERCHFEKALDFLLRFQERIKGLDGWTDARNRLSWVKGGVYARLGETELAADQFEIARKALLESGPDTHALAVHLDQGMLMARRLHEQNLWALRRLVGACQNRLKLEKKLRRRVNRLEEVLVRKPEKAFAALARLRASFVVSVPGLL